MSNRLRTRLLAVAAVLFLVATPLAGVAAAQSGLGINTSAEQYPDTYVYEDRLTVATHDRADMAPLEYENNDGEITAIDAMVNGTEAGERIEIRADKIHESDFNQFPRKGAESGNNSASALDASEWTASGASVSQADGSTASGVQAITVSSSGSLSSGSESVSYTNLSETSDPNKRVLQLVGNVGQLEAGAEVEIRLEDGDGTTKSVYINASRDATADDVMATATGNGYVLQEKLGDLSASGGDGSFNGITKITVEFSGADASVTLTAINAERMSEWTLGTTRVSDGDGGYKDETVTERTSAGAVQLIELESMGETFSDSTINDLTYINVHHRMQDRPSMVDASFPEASSYPSYPNYLDLTAEFTLPTAYEISHGSTLELRSEQTFLSDRYTRLRYAEGVGDTDAENVSSSTWVDASGSLGERNTTVVLDATVQPGSTYYVQQETLLQQSQVDALEQSVGGGGFWSDSGGGGGEKPWTSAVNWVASLVTGLLTALGIRKSGS
jgi:hypothetical protein